MDWIGIGWCSGENRVCVVVEFVCLGVCLGRGVPALDQVDVLGWGLFIFVDIDG